MHPTRSTNPGQIEREAESWFAAAERRREARRARAVRRMRRRDKVDRLLVALNFAVLVALLVHLAAHLGADH